MASLHIRARRAVSLGICFGVFGTLTPAWALYAPTHDPKAFQMAGQMLAEVLAKRGASAAVTTATTNAVALALPESVAAAAAPWGGAAASGLVAGFLLGAGVGSALGYAKWCFTSDFCWDSNGGVVFSRQNGFKNQPLGNYPAMSPTSTGYRHNKTTNNKVDCYSTSNQGLGECIAPAYSKDIADSSLCKPTATSACISRVGCACASGQGPVCLCSGTTGAYIASYSSSPVSAGGMPAQCQNGVANVSDTGKVSCGIPNSTPFPGDPNADPNYFEPMAPGRAFDNANTTIPADVRTAPLSPKQLEDIANDSWKRASQKPGYAGLPYDPITDAEAPAAYQNGLQRGLPAPTVAGLLSNPDPALQSNAVGAQGSGPGGAPQATGVMQGADLANKTNFGTQAVPSGAPASPQTLTNVGVSGGGAGTVNVQVDVKVENKFDASDPQKPEPVLEDTPYWQKWRDDWMAAVPFWKKNDIANVSLSGDLTCPTWEGYIPYLKVDLKLDQHCPILESQRSVLQTMFMAIYGFVCLVMLLRM